MINIETAERLRATIALIIMYFPTISIVGYGQAWLAYKFGDKTGKSLGYLTLNPIKHFDVVGFVFLCIFGMGWRKTIPVNQKGFGSRFAFLKLITVFFSPVVMHIFLSCFLLFVVVLMGGGFVYSVPIYPSVVTTIKFVLTHGAVLNIILSGWYFAIGLIRMMVALFTHDADIYSRTSDIIFLIFSILFAWIVLGYLQQFIYYFIIVVERFFSSFLYMR